MKDLQNFSKLFNIQIPVEEHAEYYFNLLKRSEYNPSILDWVDLYTSYEQSVDEPFGHKMASMQKLITFFKESQLYENFNANPQITKELAEYKMEMLNKVASYGENPENIYLSIDLSKANYQILKSYDDENILKNSWDDFLDSQDISPIFKLSKPFRQHVFGNLNPSRIQRHQAIIMDKLSQNITTHYGFELILKTYDELIYKVENLDSTFIDFSDHTSYKTKETTFILNKIGKDKYVKSVLDKNGYVTSKELKGVEGNMFYMYLKKYFLGEDYDERDLLFINNQRVAKWVDTL